MKWMVMTTIKGTRGQHHRRTYVGYTTCLLFFFWLLSLWSPTCWLWRRDNDEVDGDDDDQRDKRTTSPKNVRWLYYLSVVLVFKNKCLCCFPHAGYGRGILTRRMVDDRARGQHCRRKYVGYTTCLLFFGGFLISVVSHMLAMAEGQR